MFTTLITATLVSVFAAIQGARADISVSTPSISQCGDVHLSWEKSVGPYNVAVVSVDDPCNDVLVDLGDHNGTTMTWHNVTLSPGTEVLFSILDSGSDEGWSGKITIKNGTESCLPSKAVSSTSSAAASSTTASASAGTTLVVTGTHSVAATTSVAAIPVGAANAGEISASGAMSSVRLPAAATFLGSLAAIAVALAL